MNSSHITATYTLNPHYQVYYWTALQNVVALSVAGGPWWYRYLPWADYSLDLETVSESVRAKLGLQRRWVASAVDQFVARYDYRGKDGGLTFAIDAHDGKEIFSPELQKSCDIYFKANRWRNEKYEENVLPIVNGNGFLRERHLKKLMQMRNTPEEIDFLFISRIWGGVEHNVRLFETLAKLPFKKKLIAIFVKGVASEKETESAITRLQKAGVECTYNLIPIKELWQSIARSRVVMIRAGKYMCIPWRMIDLLCMGACMVTDMDFEPQWPAPLVPGKEYISAGISRPADTSAAPPEEYEKLQQTMAKLLADKTRIAEIKMSSADYFDRQAAPAKVGHYIHQKIQERLHC